MRFFKKGIAASADREASSRSQSPESFDGDSSEARYLGVLCPIERSAPSATGITSGRTQSPGNSQGDSSEARQLEMRFFKKGFAASADREASGRSQSLEKISRG